MNLVLKTTNIEVEPELKKWIEEKFFDLARQEKYLEKPEAKLWVEIEKITRGQRKGRIFRAEAQLYLPQKSIRAESLNESIPKAVNEVKKKLQRKIKEYREKRRVQD